MPNLLLIPGTTLEGGGQLVRLSVCLSALTGTAIEITDIRGGRPGRGGEGLKNQHLTAVSWLAEACGAATEGMVVRSRRLVFEPWRSCSTKRSIPPAHPTTLSDSTPASLLISIALGTPGAITLVAQAILPFLLFSHRPPTPKTPSSSSPPHSSASTLTSTSTPIFLTLHGGTNVPLSPSIDYLSQVLLPNLSLLGLPPIRLSPTHPLVRGWTTGRPEMGSATFLVHPLSLGAKLPAFRVGKRDKVTRIAATVLAHGEDVRREIRGAVRAAVLERWVGEEVEVEVVVDEESGSAKRMYLLLVAHTAGGWRLGRDWLCDAKIGKDGAGEMARRLVERVVGELEGELRGGACVDEYMMDQLVVFQALADGRSVVEPGMGDDGRGRELTLHARTARWIVGELLGVEFDAEGGCRGVGLVAGERFIARKRAERREQEREDDELNQGVEQMHIGEDDPEPRRGRVEHDEWQEMDAKEVTEGFARLGIDPSLSKPSVKSNR